MRRLLVLLAVLVVALTGLVACGNDSASAERMSPTEFKEAVAEPGVVVLDVRTPAEFAEGHLAGAINIDVEGGRFAEEIADLDKGATYAVYCRSGNRSQVAADQMRDAGFTDVFDMTGGIVEWAAAGGEIVTD